MSDTAVNAASQPVNLIGHVTGDNTDSGSWHRSVAPNHYAFLIIGGSLGLLWLLGGAFRTVRA